jgi:hypothetical protein
LLIINVHHSAAPDASVRCMFLHIQNKAGADIRRLLNIPCQQPFFYFLC